MIEEIAKAHDAIFVDGYNAVPHDLAHVEDNVHLTDDGAAVLAEAIAGTLLSDPRFLQLAERVRAEVSVTPGPAQP
jgi:hypothetical protein